MSANEGLENTFTRRAASAIIALLLVLALAALATSCGNKEELSKKVRVVVTILPQAEFVENVGGERVDVTVMVPPGASLHVYEPTPSQITALARATMYAKIGSGAEFEIAWMDKLIATNKKMLVVDCSRGVQLIGASDEHGDEGQGDEPHSPGLPDPHIWLSPMNARIMVQNICDGLVQVDPDNKAYYEQNRDAYLQRLTQLDQDIRDALSGVPNRRFMVYHPSLGYFAKDYGLTMIPIEEWGKEPTAANIVHLIEEAKQHNMKTIFASPEFNPQSAKVIAEAIGGRVVFIDPLARDYILNMRAILGELVRAMG